MEETKPQEITLNFIKDIQTREKRTTEFLGEKIIIHKNVFPVDSPFSHTTKIIAKEIPKNPGVVLDIGTGTGVFSIMAVKKGATKVIAIDIDENSLKNAEANVEFHKLKKVIEIRKSDLFNNIKENEKFDLMLANLPLADVNYKTPLGHFLFDTNFKLHERLLKSASDYLNINGKIFIPSGDIANEKKLNELIKKYNYKILEIKEDTFQNLKWKLYILGKND